MKQYMLFKHPSGSTEAVKQGWSWPAFFFGFIWAFVKKLYVLGSAVLLGCFLLGVLLGLAGAGDIADAFGDFLGLVIGVVFGIKGNAWRESNLISRGFEHVGTISAATPEQAIAVHTRSLSPLPAEAASAAL